MGRQVFDTNLNPEIFVQSVAGDLSVRGWDSPQVAVTADPEDLEIDQAEDRLTVNCSGDLDLRLPIRSNLNIDSCAGDASLKLLEQTLQIGEVAGTLDIRNVVGVHLSSVAGNLSVKNASSDVIVGEVAGNADLRNILGACRLNNVDGNLELQNIEGEIIANAQGNARLRLNQLAAADYTITADGNIYCYLPEDASVRLSMTSDGESIKVRLPDSARTYRQNRCDLTLGVGAEPATNMTLVADGSIYLFADQGGWSGSDSSFTGLPDDFGQQIARQVESQIQSQMEEVTRNMNEQMEQLSARLSQAGLSPEDTERIVEQAMRNSERETARAQEKMRRAQEKLERKLEGQRRKVEAKAQAADRRSRRSWGFEWPAPPTPPAPPPPPVVRRDSATEEERLMILRMLEQKKITLDEADKLLSALESKE